MKINSLKLKDFKNIKEETIVFSDNINVLYGDNGVGKTNVLEAIFLFSAGKSFRGSKNRDFIRFDTDQALLEIEFETNTHIKNTRDTGQPIDITPSPGVKQTLAIRFEKGQNKKIYKNGTQVTKVSEYLGIFRSVIFTPDHLNLVKGSPEIRRRFLDLAIFQCFPRYVGVLSQYNRTVSQKNALLKTKTVSKELLEVYNEKIATLGAHITVFRKKYVSLLMGEAECFMREMTKNTEVLELEYIAQVSTEEENDKKLSDEIKERYLELLQSKKEQEIQRGVSLYGPHKDDFVININQKNAKIFASQGQQRSAVLALKLAEGEISKRITGEYPVFLLDDILSELDTKRKNFVLKKTAGKQVILTGCEKDFFATVKSDNKIYMEDGKCFFT